MSNKLEGKVAVITGGSSGIGLATAKRFAAEGAKVVITGRNLANLNEAVSQIGHGAQGVQSDSSKISDLEALFTTVKKTFGNIDVLVANSAVYVLGSLADFTEEMFDQQSDVNFKGTFFTVQKALPYLNRGASVILLSSLVNEKGIPNHASYSATKAAIRSLARSFSAELIDSGIRVNVLSPGPINTPVFEKTMGSKENADAFKVAMTSFNPAKRLGEPEEIAAGALYLASDESAYMVGAELLIDGGQRSI